MRKRILDDLDNGIRIDHVTTDSAERYEVVMGEISIVLKTKAGGSFYATPEQLAALFAAITKWGFRLDGTS